MDNIQFMSNNHLQAEDLDGDIPIKPGTAAAGTTTANTGGGELRIDLNSSTSSPGLVSTLDEPVSVTISRDLKAVGYKFGHVFFPKRSNLLLKDWDLWGPLCLSVLLSVTLQGDVKQEDGAPQFASIFTLLAVGAIVVTINTKLLSGKISFFQSICVLGYCLLPLVLVSLTSNISTYFINLQSTSVFIVRLVLVFVAFGWSLFASTAFLAADTINLSERKALALFPIFLFYFVISWLIILHTN